MDALNAEGKQVMVVRLPNGQVMQVQPVGQVMGQTQTQAQAPPQAPNAPPQAYNPSYQGETMQ